MEKTHRWISDEISMQTQSHRRDILSRLGEQTCSPLGHLLILLTDVCWAPLGVVLSGDRHISKYMQCNMVITKKIKQAEARAVTELLQIWLPDRLS